MLALIYNRWVLKNYLVGTLKDQFNTMLCSFEMNKTQDDEQSEIWGLETVEALYKNIFQCFI